MNLKIEYVNKEKLKPYKNNAKIHTDSQIEQIKNSIREFGFNDPIAVWHDNEIIEGHGRLIAAMQMEEIETVPVIRLDELTDKQRKAYMLAHNKLTMNTDFDIDLLSKEITELDGALDLTDFGFNEAEILELTIDDSPADIPASPQVVPHSVVGGTDGPSYPQDSAEAQNPVSVEGYPVAEQEVSRSELNDYSERAETLVTKRVIIVYRTPEEEAFVKSILGVGSEQLGVIYTAASLMSENQQEG